jgi:hypothetical protein
MLAATSSVRGVRPSVAARVERAVSTSRAVHAAELVHQGAADANSGEAGERNAALGVEALRAHDQRHHRRGRELVATDVGGYFGERLADKVSDERQVVLDEASDIRVGLGRIINQHELGHWGPPP